MQLTFLGAGAHTTPGEFNSNMLVEENGKKLLIDCGFTCAAALAEVGLSHRDIDAVYISHLHFDHVAGLEWLGFYTRFDPGCTRKPVLYVADTLVDELWDNVLRGSMETVKGHHTLTLDDYFNVQSVPLDIPSHNGVNVYRRTTGKFKWEGVTFNMIPFEHIKGLDDTVYSFGLFVTKSKMIDRILITTDTVFDHSNHDLYDIADVIYHDCETIPNAMSGVHPHYEALRLLPEKTRNKMWLYHRNNDLYFGTVKTDGFKGFVHKGETHVFGMLGETEG